MVNFCSNCGAEVKNGAKFCEHCGTKLVKDEAPAQPSASTAPAAPAAPAAFVENDNPYRRSNNTAANDQNSAEKTAYPWENAENKNAYNPFPESGLKEQFFKTKGRLNRWRYFKRCLGIAGIAMVLIIISGILIGTNHQIMGGMALIGIIIGAQIASICLVIRRFHDMEPANNTDMNFMVKRMGAYIGFIFASWVWDWAWIFTTLMSLYLLFNTGYRGANRHGADPLEV